MADIVFPGQKANGPIGNLPANYDLQIYRGDALSFNVTITNNGTPMNLTGFTPAATIKQNYSDTQSHVADCSIVDETGGVVSVTFHSSITETITAGSYIWDFQLTEPKNNDVRTYITGDVQVYDEVTSP